MDVNQICFCKSRYEHNKTEVTSKLRHDIMDVTIKMLRGIFVPGRLTFYDKNELIFKFYPEELCILYA